MEEQAKEYLQQGKYKQYLECVHKIYKKDETPRNKDLYSAAQKMYQSYREVLEFKKKDVRDLYGLLDVSKDASTDEIKRSYRSLVLKFHPDRSLIRESGEVLQDIMSAYNTLVDPQKRAMYDNRVSDSRFRTGVAWRSTDFFFFGDQNYRRSTVFEDEFDLYRFIYNLDHMSRAKNIYIPRANRHQGEMDVFAYIKAIVVLLLFVFIIIVVN